LHSISGIFCHAFVDCLRSNANQIKLPNEDIMISQRNTTDKLTERLLGSGKPNSEDLPLPSGLSPLHNSGKCSKHVGVKSVSTPLPQTKTPLSKADGPTPQDAAADLEFDDIKSKYAEDVGLALWLANQTRPDISQAVSTLARFTANPGKRHREALKHLGRYLVGTRDLGLHYRRHPAGERHQATGWTDADWGNCQDTQRSTNGCLLFVNGGVVDHHSNRQATIAMSTYESELIALCAGALAVVHLRRLLEHMGNHQLQPTTIFVDNTAAVAQANNDTVTRRARHLSLRTFKVRELVLAGQIIVHWVAGGNNISDLLTKNVTKGVMDKLRPLILSHVPPHAESF
jgi:hypothetical protein